MASVNSQMCPAKALADKDISFRSLDPFESLSTDWRYCSSLHRKSSQQYEKTFDDAHRYATIQQALVTKQSVPIYVFRDIGRNMYNIFGPFDVFLWIGIVVECFIIWILFLIIEVSPAVFLSLILKPFG